MNKYSCEVVMAVFFSIAVIALTFVGANWAVARGNTPATAKTAPTRVEVTIKIDGDPEKVSDFLKEVAPAIEWIDGLHATTAHKFDIDPSMVKLRPQP